MSVGKLASNCRKTMFNLPWTAPERVESCAVLAYIQPGPGAVTLPMGQGGRSRADGLCGNV